MSPDDQALLVAAQSEAAATSLQLMETREALSFARMEADRLARQPAGQLMNFSKKLLAAIADGQPSETSANNFSEK